MRKLKKKSVRFGPADFKGLLNLENCTTGSVEMPLFDETTGRLMFSLLLSCVRAFVWIVLYVSGVCVLYCWV